MINLPLHGGCQCGQLRYTINALPQTLYCCHCTDCQAQSASAFGTSLRCDGGSVNLSGESKSFRRDKGRPTEVECVFCPYCGSRILHRRDSHSADYSIKAGSLDDPTAMQPVGHIWTRSKQPWVTFPGDSLQFEQQPGDGYQSMMDLFRKRYGP